MVKPSGAQLWRNETKKEPVKVHPRDAIGGNPEYDNPEGFNVNSILGQAQSLLEYMGGEPVSESSKQDLSVTPEIAQGLAESWNKMVSILNTENPSEGSQTVKIERTVTKFSIIGKIDFGGASQMAEKGTRFALEQSKEVGTATIDLFKQISGIGLEQPKSPKQPETNKSKEKEHLAKMRNLRTIQRAEAQKPKIVAEKEMMDSIQNTQKDHAEQQDVIEIGFQANYQENFNKPYYITLRRTVFINKIRNFREQQRQRSMLETKQAGGARGGNTNQNTNNEGSGAGSQPSRGAGG